MSILQSRRLKELESQLYEANLRERQEREFGDRKAVEADRLRSEVEQLRAEVERLQLEYDDQHSVASLMHQQAEKAEAERDSLRAERDTMLLHTRDFVSWFNRHYQDPSYNLDHPWCVINARLDAYADTLAAIDAARGNDGPQT